MNPNITLGEVKAHCAEMSARYGDEHCCNNCKFSSMECCDPPEHWKLDSDTPINTEKVCESRPDWESLYHMANEAREACHNRANALEAENAKLHTIVSTIETLLGRKFNV